MRVQQLVTYPLSKASESKVRIDYKVHNGLAKNCSMESVFRNLGIFNKTQANLAMVDLYNRRIQSENVKLLNQRKVVKETKNGLKKETKNNFTQLSYSDAFEITNKQQASRKIINKIFSRKVIEKRQNIVSSESTFKSYETYTIPCYDSWYQKNMKNIIISLGYGMEDTDYIEIHKKDVVRYAKQTLQYTEIFMKKSFQKYRNIRVYCTINFKCYDKRKDPNEGDYLFLFKKNIGRVDINTFDEFKKYYINGIIEGFNEAMGRDYIVCYGIDTIDVNVLKYNPLAWSGSSYTALPKIIYDTKSVINIKNIDQKCFLYSLIASRYTP